MTALHKSLMHLTSRVLALVFAVLAAASSAAANEDWSEYNGNFCGGAQTGNWETLLNYARDRVGISIADALRDVRCVLSRGTSAQYVGNMLHASIRQSPSARDVLLNTSHYLLKDNPTPENRQVFISLVLGDGVDHNLFHQIQSTDRMMPGRRDISMFAARVICMSIDRYDITELADIRANECNTPPFVEPWR